MTQSMASDHSWYCMDDSTDLWCSYPNDIGSVLLNQERDF